MNTKDQILKMCVTPKTAAELAIELKLSIQGVYTQLSGLQRAKKIEKRGDGKRRAMPATFVVTRNAPTIAEHTDDYENLAITRAHNPFNLTGAM